MKKSTHVVLALAMVSLALFLTWLMLPPAASLSDLVAWSHGGKEQGQVQTDATSRGPASVRNSKDASAVESMAGHSATSADFAEPLSSSAPATGSPEPALEQGQRSAEWEEAQPEAQPGQWMIAGLVQDEDGKPLGNIEVFAELIQPKGDTASREDSGLAGETSSWTGFDGAFVFEELVDGEYRIHAAPNDRFAPAEIKARVGVMSANLVLVRQREIKLFGVVSGREGTELDAVRVIAGPPTRVTESGLEGSYELEISIQGKNRPHTIHFRKEGYRDQSVRLDPAELDDMLDYFELDVAMERLEGLTTVSGRLMDTEGHPIAGTIVNMRSPELSNSYRAQSDSSGRFTLEGVEPGLDYQINVRPGAGFRDYQQSQLQIPANGLQLDIVLDPLERGEFAGVMTDVNGRPISGFSMTLQSQSAAGRTVQVVSDSTGYFSVKGFPAGGALLKTNSYPVFETRGFDVSPEGVEPVLVVLDIGPGALFGRVESVPGETVAASDVSLSWQHTVDGVANYSVRKTTADQNGNFVFTGLGPGAHTLRVNAPGFGMATLEIDPGMNTDNIVVELSKEG